MKKNILFIYKGPFGTLTDSYKWCQYLKDEYDIKFVELLGEGEMSLSGIHLVRVSNKGSRFFRGIRFILVCLYNILISKGPIVVFYFDGCSIFKRLFPWKKMILDIRTLSVSRNPIERERSDSILSDTCSCYDKITIIQEDLIDKLQIDRQKCDVVPLGADVISSVDKHFDELHLLYVGTLEGRNIGKTIEGLAIFNKKYPEAILTYEIIGEGISETSEMLRKKILEYNLGSIVKAYGRLPYNMLKPYFDRCNIGVSFIPQTPWYDLQPPTKTYEYIMSCMFCLATSTSENKKIISKANGLLHDDNSISFSHALENLYLNKTTINPQEIRNSLKDCSWESIVNVCLKPIISNL